MIGDLKSPKYTLLAICVMVLNLVPSFGIGEEPQSQRRVNSTALVWNEKKALELVALPLSCVDRPHKKPRGRSYLYETTYLLHQNYESSLSFYGCSDWHSAVNSIWTMVRVLKDFPESAVASLIREKLENHLSEQSLAGEVKFFTEEARPSFERPYGWAWLFKLYVELETWEDDDAERWTSHLQPLAELLAEKMLEYLTHLSRPIRVGTHANTAFSLKLAWEYADVVDDQKLADAVKQRTYDFFIDDTACPTVYEPSGSDFLSPCLSEAVLMSRAFDRQRFSLWLTNFLTDVDTLREQVIVNENYLEIESGDRSSLSEGAVEAEGEVNENSERTEPLEQGNRLIGARSHLIGLAFARAGDLLRLAESLPVGDPRVGVFREVATLQARHGFEKMYEADYFGTHWLASFAVRMLTSSFIEGK